MAEPVKHLFVYGTLMRGQANHDRFCADALTIEPAVTTGRLYHLPMGFPALIDADDGQVFGEAVSFPDLNEALLLMDRLEGYDAARPDDSMYVRVIRYVRLLVGGEIVSAFVYLWNGALPKGTVLSASGRWHSGGADAPCSRNRQN